MVDCRKTEMKTRKGQQNICNFNYELYIPLYYNLLEKKKLFSKKKKKITSLYLPSFLSYKLNLVSSVNNFLPRVSTFCEIQGYFFLECTAIVTRMWSRLMSSLSSWQRDISVLSLKLVRAFEFNVTAY